MSTPTCEYIARKSNPKSWHGTDSSTFYLDKNPNQGGLNITEWHCPHPPLDRKDDGEKQYCVFHTDPAELPEDIDESEALLDALKDVGNGSKTSRQEHSGQFIGATFGPIDLSSETISATDDYDIRFDHARFQSADETLDFSYTKFITEGNSPISFAGADFETTGKGTVTFHSAIFQTEGNGDLIFKDATFSAAGNGVLLFSKSTFRTEGGGSILFNQATFETAGEGAVLFDDTTFRTEAEGHIWFSGTEFKTVGDGDVWFSSAKFQATSEGELWFQNATFQTLGEASVVFSTTTFRTEDQGRIWFGEAMFRSHGDGDVVFRGATFRTAGKGAITFSMAEFRTEGSGTLLFEPTRFLTEGKGDIIFIGSRFRASGQGDLGFGNTDFQSLDKGNVRFTGVIFRTDDGGHIMFNSTSFRAISDGDVSFDDATFLAESDGVVSFDEAVFESGKKGNVFFDYVEFPVDSDGDISFRKADLHDTYFRGIEFSGADFGGADFTGADLREARFDDVSVNGRTACERLNEGYEKGDSNGRISAAIDSLKQPFKESEFDSESWDSTARAYHQLKMAFSSHGLVGKARNMHFRERRARNLESKAANGWLNLWYLRSLPSRFFTGYGVQVVRLMIWMIVLFTISTAAFVWVGVEDTLVNNISYSVLAFTVAPPRIPSGVGVQLVMMLETFFGTLSIVLLGYILANRERF